MSKERNILTMKNIFGIPGLQDNLKTTTDEGALMAKDKNRECYLSLWLRHHVLAISQNAKSKRIYLSCCSVWSVGKL